MLHEIARLDPQSEVVTTDLNSVDTDYPGEDIQHLSFKDASYAMILCNHVLEHVREDVKGVAECARVLKPGGIAVFTVPGDFDKASTKQFEKPDDNGHYRHYGMDLLQVFGASFDQVKAIDMSEAANESWHVRAFDYSFVCYKFGERAWA